MIKVLFLGCNYDQLPYLNAAKKCGFFVVGCDKNFNAPGKKLCNHFINLGYDEAEFIYKKILEIGFNGDDKIFTAAAQFAHQTASKIAKKIKISYPVLSHIKSILNKTDYYDVFRKLDVNIPETQLVQNRDELSQKIKKGKNYYLKSDFSKNPNYVYRIDNNFDLSQINWTNDRYFVKNYILQNEFEGQSLRINFADDNFFVFDFDSGRFNLKVTDSLSDDIKKDIYKIVDYYGISKWIVKFDVILNKASNDYVFLDIGIDPPFRMLKAINANGYNFEELYTEKYLLLKEIQWRDFL